MIDNRVRDKLETYFREGHLDDNSEFKEFKGRSIYKRQTSNLA